MFAKFAVALSKLIRHFGILDKKCLSCILTINKMSQHVTKPTKWHVHPERHSDQPVQYSQSNQSLCCPHEEALGLWVLFECTAKTGQVILLVLSLAQMIFTELLKMVFFVRVQLSHFGLHSKNFFSSVCLDQIPWDYKNDHLSLIWIFLLILYHISKRNNSL